MLIPIWKGNFIGLLYIMKISPKKVAKPKSAQVLVHDPDLIDLHFFTNPDIIITYYV